MENKSSTMSNSISKSMTTEYKEVLDEVKAFWERGDASLIADKVLEKPYDNAPKNRFYLIKRIGDIKVGAAQDTKLLMEMHKHTSARRKMLESLRKH